MPSGPPEWHEKWTNAGPSEGGDLNAMRYLQSRGYHITGKWTWIKPEADHVVTDEEANAIDYLILEWDFGGMEDIVPCRACGSTKTVEKLHLDNFVSCCPERTVNDMIAEVPAQKSIVKNKLSFFDALERLFKDRFKPKPSFEDFFK